MGALEAIHNFEEKFSNNIKNNSLIESNQQDQALKKQK